MLVQFKFVPRGERATDSGAAQDLVLDFLLLHANLGCRLPLRLVEKQSRVVVGFEFPVGIGEDSGFA